MFVELTNAEFIELMSHLALASRRKPEMAQELRELMAELEQQYTSTLGSAGLVYWHAGHSEGSAARHQSSLLAHAA
jgi:hypothetical protein